MGPPTLLASSLAFERDTGRNNGRHTHRMDTRNMARTTLERTENIRRPEEDSLTTAIAPGSESYREKSSAGRFYKGLLIPGSWRSTNLLKSPLRIALLAFLLPLGIR